jgi:tyrosyl-tRNA synthetase
MYGKLMSISDDLMWKYYTFLTDLKASEIDAMKDEVSHGGLHPMHAKKNLAHGIVRDFHGAAAADAAAESWAKQFQQKAVSEDVPVVKVAGDAEGLADADGAIKLAKLLQLAGLAASAGEATRKIAENAVSVNGEKVSARAIAKSVLGDGPVLRLGKRSVKVEWVQ